MHITRVTLMKALAFSNNQLPQISYMVYIHKKKTNYLWDQWNIIHVMRFNCRLKALINSNIWLLHNFSL